jgi:hypothetical protein
VPAQAAAVGIAAVDGGAHIESAAQAGPEERSVEGIEVDIGLGTGIEAGAVEDWPRVRRHTTYSSQRPADCRHDSWGRRLAQVAADQAGRVVAERDLSRPFLLLLIGAEFQVSGSWLAPATLEPETVGVQNVNRGV